MSNNRSQINKENISVHSQNQSAMSIGSTHRNENILCAVLALIKELNESELELIKRDIDKKLVLVQDQP